jgi:hypothetical protein
VGALAQLVINVAGLLTAGVGSLWIGRRLSRRRAIVELRARRATRRQRVPSPPAERWIRA